jgi:transposase-like protein
MDNLSLKNFYKRFPNEKMCLIYLEQLRWPDKRVCPRCGSDRTYKYSNGKVFKCSSCRRQFTAIIGTVFMKSHVPLQEWFLAVGLSGSQGRGITSLRLSEYLGVTQKTAWSMLRRIRYGLTYGGCAEESHRDRGASLFESAEMFDDSIRKLTSVSLPADLHT